MAKVTIRIEHVAWRDGRPRFVPGPALRALKLKGQDLKHPNGRWMSAEEAAAWVETELRPMIQRNRDRKSEGKRLVAPRAAAVYSVEQLFDEWFKSPRFTGGASEGKRQVKPLAANTVAFYKGNARRLGEYDGELYGSAAAALTKEICFGLYEQLWQDKGLASARAMMATLSSALSWGLKRGKVTLPVNPALGLGMQTPEPRIRAGEPEEISHLIAAADAIGRPEIGDMIALGVWTGQRQVDRLALEGGSVVDGRRRFRQSKTGAIVAIPDAPELAARLEAAAVRRARLGIVNPRVVVDERRRRAFDKDTYWDAFDAVRRAAVAGVTVAGVLVLAPMPSLADFRDQDLRDTAVTWLARAGCTEGEIASITGHAIASIKAILKHYLAMHPELADHAIARLTAWHAGR